MKHKSILLTPKYVLVIQMLPCLQCRVCSALASTLERLEQNRPSISSMRALVIQQQTIVSNGFHYPGMVYLSERAQLIAEGLLFSLHLFISSNLLLLFFLDISISFSFYLTKNIYHKINIYLFLKETFTILFYIYARMRMCYGARLRSLGQRSLITTRVRASWNTVGVAYVASEVPATNVSVGLAPRPL